MIRRKLSIKILLIILACTLSVRWANNWKQIKETAENTISLSAQFTQKKYMKILTKPLISKGSIFFLSPNSLRWEYISPVQSILLMHRGRIKRYIKVEGVYTEDVSAKLQGMRIIMEEIVMWLTGSFDQNPNFSASLSTRPASKIVLRPKKKSFADIIQRIELKLSPKPGVIRSVKLIENKNSFTLLEFTNVELNKRIKESVFREIE